MLGWPSASTWAACTGMGCASPSCPGWGAGWLGTSYGLAPRYGPQANDSNVFQFQSLHGGVVNFPFADGHVSGIRQTADYWAYIAASGMADGQPLADF